MVIKEIWGIVIINRTIQISIGGATISPAGIYLWDSELEPKKWTHYQYQLEDSDYLIIIYAGFEGNLPIDDSINEDHWV